jgi:hypothetical protein
MRNYLQTVTLDRNSSDDSESESPIISFNTSGENFQ